MVGPACTAQHVPEYINSKKLKDAGKVYVVAVNDPFVMKSWAESLDAGGKSGVSKHPLHTTEQYRENPPIDPQYINQRFRSASLPTPMAS